jgi:hypothetical protein
LMFFDDRGVKGCHSRQRMGISWPTSLTKRNRRCIRCF